MEPSTEFAYQGNELEAFAGAINWKSYWARRLKPYIGARVIEVGAGLGGSTAFLCDAGNGSWICLDPDPAHVSRLKGLISAGELPSTCEATCGVLGDMASDMRADTILYIDVLEHIEKDEDEVRLAAARLDAGGRLVVLSPAFNFLFSPFDRAVGHFRRYTRKDARRLTVTGLTLERTFYLDSVGFFASLANRLLLQASEPSRTQVRFWDRVLVPISVYADRVFGALFGKTIVMIWKKS